jgi:hypothetical protein
MNGFKTGSCIFKPPVNSPKEGKIMWLFVCIRHLVVTFFELTFIVATGWKWPEI